MRKVLAEGEHWEGINLVNDGLRRRLRNVDIATEAHNAVPLDQLQTLIAAAIAGSGVLVLQGDYDPTVTSNFPLDTDCADGAGPIKKGFCWRISKDGNIGNEEYEMGDVIFALADSPGQTLANWDDLQTNNPHFQSDSWANWNAKKLAGILPKGFNIRINDPNGTASLVTVFCEETNQVRKKASGYTSGDILIEPKVQVQFNANSGILWNVTDVLAFANGAAGKIVSISDTIVIPYSNLSAGVITVGNTVTGTGTGFTGTVLAVNSGPDFIVVQVDGGDPFDADGEVEITIDQTLATADVDDIKYTMGVRVTSATDVIPSGVVTNSTTLDTATVTSVGSTIISAGMILTGQTSNATALIETYTGTGYGAATATLSGIGGAYQLDEVITTPGGGTAYAGNVANADEAIEGWTDVNYLWSTNTAS